MSPKIPFTHILFFTPHPIDFYLNHVEKSCSCFWILRSYALWAHRVPPTLQGCRRHLDCDRQQRQVCSRKMPTPSLSHAHIPTLTHISTTTPTHYPLLRRQAALKKGKPFMPAAERVKMVRALSCVDAAIEAVVCAWV